MIARLKRYLAERREAAQVPTGWESPEAAAELARIVREATGEHGHIGPRHGAVGYAATPADYRPRHAAPGPVCVERSTHVESRLHAPPGPQTKEST
ncbi:hypothetical protein DER29_0513 [Micromonospora sp. M71_S20]|uniref:hypothetical protein n=1 Tax=Micromonospora sp. M71_S20 TaxID=592872 RepID=UPI000EB02ABA|nr:hypothetical protein [Micromonospora sp. M71_S20]RLK22674.1 hypothetical protein DER29_0513 [Micromonospora sp. M71_S20]